MNIKKLTEGQKKGIAVVAGVGVAAGVIYYLQKAMAPKTDELLTDGGIFGGGGITPGGLVIPEFKEEKLIPQDNLFPNGGGGGGGQGYTPSGGGSYTPSSVFGGGGSSPDVIPKDRSVTEKDLGFQAQYSESVIPQQAAFAIPSLTQLRAVPVDIMTQVGGQIGGLFGGFGKILGSFAGQLGSYASYGSMLPPFGFGAAIGQKIGESVMKLGLPSLGWPGIPSVQAQVMQAPSAPSYQQSISNLGAASSLQQISELPRWGSGEAQVSELPPWNPPSVAVKPFSQGQATLVSAKKSVRPWYSGG